MAQSEMPKLFSELDFLRHKFYNQLVDSLLLGFLASPNHDWCFKFQQKYWNIWGILIKLGVQFIWCTIDQGAEKGIGISVIW